MAHRLAVFLVTVAVLVGVAAPTVAHASTVTVREHGLVRVIDGLSHAQLTATTVSGVISRGQVLRVPVGTFGIAPRSARNTMVGLETNQAMALRERNNGAVVGINGGYWLSRPSGVPNGLHVEDGRMSSAHAAFRSGTPISRATVGFRTDGALLFDRLNTTVTLTTVLGDIPVDEFNRNIRNTTDGTRAVTTELLLFDDRYGAAIAVPAGAVIVTLDSLQMGSNQAVTSTVTAVTTTFEPTSVRVANGGGLIVAYGEKTALLNALISGMQITVTNTITPFESPANMWDGLAHAIAGGPHLISNGQARSLTAWRQEGFSDSHLTGRSPRTAIAQTADGTVLLVTIDGRQPGWSAGVTLRELTDLLLLLGARDAVNLDGGGSTVMTKNAQIVNRPSETRRSVANGLFVYVPLPTAARGATRACDTQLAASPFFDVASSVHVAAITCLSSYAITSGVTDTQFMPQGIVTRGQMATFLSTFIDQMAARGGRTLPQVTATTFTDVASYNVHKVGIERLAAAGIWTGKTATTFAPNEPVTRAQTARMIAETTRYVTGRQLPQHRDTFSDDATSVHEDAIDRLNGVGVIGGVGGFAFNPSDAVTRGAMASILMRTTDYLIEVGPVR